MKIDKGEFEGSASDGAAKLVTVAATNLTAIVAENELPAYEQLVAVSIQAQLANALAQLAQAEATDRQTEAVLKHPLA